MNELISGQVDLSRLLDAESTSRLADCLTYRADDVAQDSDALCITIGSPRFPGDKRAVEESAGAPGFLRAWQKHGPDAVALARGSYAVVIVDAAKKSVFLAVDRFSRQSLCYSLAGQKLSFSDRADRVADRGNELDAQALFDYLFFHMIPAPLTIFRKVRRLPPAHSLLIDAGGVRELRHWSLSFDETHREPFAEAAERFRTIIRDGVATELAGEKRVGAFLSGGTDSSTVAGTLCELAGIAAPAYSIGFAAEGYDEMEYARIAARHFGCEHHEYYVTPADLLASVPVVARSFDQPFGNSSALPAYYCARMAQADGCSKMLAGDGGDELFAGNTRYATQRMFEVYHSVPRGVREFIEPLCSDDSLSRRIPGLRQASGYVRYSRVPMPDRLQSFNLLIHLGTTRVLTADFLARVSLSEPLEHMRKTWNECTTPSLINRMLAYDWRYTLADSDLPKVRGATSLAGIDVAYPLLSDELTDFSMSLPPEWKLRRFKLRWFFKEALRGFLPDAIITKKKQGFGLPFGVWAMRDRGLKQLAEVSLRSLAGRGIVRADFVDQMFSEFLPEHPGYYGEMVWILMMLEQWIQGYEGLQLSA